MAIAPGGSGVKVEPDSLRMFWSIQCAVKFGRFRVSNPLSRSESWYDMGRGVRDEPGDTVRALDQAGSASVGHEIARTGEPRCYRGTKPMLSRGLIDGQTYRDPSRRAFLRAGTAGALGLTLSDVLALRAAARDSSPPARAVIMLWLWGGPSHLDTFDMKPDAPAEYRGPFEPIATAVPGMHVCELLPGLARRADRFALLRAMHHESNDHGVAGTIALTGSIAGAVGLGGAENTKALRPSTGAIVGRLHSGEPGSLPPYIILGSPLHQGLKRAVGEGGGSLGSTYDPFRLDYEPGVGLKLPDATLPEGVGAARLEARWDLLRQLGDRQLEPAGAGPAARLNRHYELAHTLIASRQSLAALDVGREPTRVREAYGPHRFGQCCLIARRLVEAGIPFVQVNWSTHVEGPGGCGRRRLGHARPLFPDHAGPPRLDARPGALGLARRPARPGPARHHPGRRRGRVRPDAEDQRPRRAATTGTPVTRPSWPGEASVAGGSSAPPTAAASTRSTGRSLPPTSAPRSSPGSASGPPT